MGRTFVSFLILQVAAQFYSKLRWWARYAIMCQVHHMPGKHGSEPVNVQLKSCVGALRGVCNHQRCDVSNAFGDIAFNAAQAAHRKCFVLWRKVKIICLLIFCTRHLLADQRCICLCEIKANSYDERICRLLYWLKAFFSLPRWVWQAKLIRNEKQNFYCVTSSMIFLMKRSLRCHGKL